MKWGVTLALSCALLPLARAQTTSDLMPPLPPLSGPPPIPGYRLPEAAPPPSPPQNGPAPPRPLVLLGDAPPPLTREVDRPTLHIVRPGETLSDLARDYLGSWTRWPELWALNPAITNPHWIYPGERVHLGRPAAATNPAPPTVRPLGRTILSHAPPRVVVLRQTGFVDSKEREAAGSIIGSKEEKQLLSTLDEAYVKLERTSSLVVGQRYSIYQPQRPLKHPSTGQRLGEIVELFGEAEVAAVTGSGRDKVARVVIIDSLNPIERGFLVGPLRRQLRTVAPRAASRSLGGVVMDTLRPNPLLAEQNLVFIDQGGNAGVEVGDRFAVVRRGDGYPRLLTYGPVDDPRFPEEQIGQILTVEVRDHFSIGMVLQAEKELEVGDRVESMRSNLKEP